VTEKFILLDNLEQYAEYCFLVDSYPNPNYSDGYWSESVKYCAATGVRGAAYSGLYIDVSFEPTNCVPRFRRLKIVVLVQQAVRCVCLKPICVPRQ